MFAILQRYKFESNSQHGSDGSRSGLRCLLSCKDTNLKAIHNTPGRGCRGRWMFAILQRYKFESNSQRRTRFTTRTSGCLLSCKDTNLKAIHNSTTRGFLINLDVCYPAKIQIWKQFTTGDKDSRNLVAMFAILQRYKFESNSQLRTFQG